MMDILKQLPTDPVFIFGLVILYAACNVAIGSAKYALIGNKNDAVAKLNLKKAKCISSIGINFFIVAYLLTSGINIF